MKKKGLEKREALGYLNEPRTRLSEIYKEILELELIIEETNYELKESLGIAIEDELIYELINNFIASLIRIVYLKESVPYYNKKIQEMEFVVSILDKKPSKFI